MKPYATEITECRLCHSSDLTPVLDIAATPIGDHYIMSPDTARELPLFPLTVNQCGTCGHVQLKVLVDPAYLYSEYIYTTSSSLGLKDHFARYAKDVVERIKLKPGSLVVDMGSNDGTLLSAFKALGMKVLGVDPAKEIASNATQAGIPTLNAFFSKEIAHKIKEEVGPASLFLANNVMANVSDPTSILEGVRELLTPDGVFVFETGYLKHLAEDCVFDNIHHEHIDYYSIAPLVTFFDKLGLQLFHVDVSDSKGSSIRSYVQFKGGQFSVSGEVEALLKREQEWGYATPAPYIHLSERLQRTKVQLHQILKELRASGKRISGYGAAIGSTTMLYHLELGGQIDKLIDDNPIRHGRFSPGIALPVVDSGILDSPSAPDYVVILAWRYAEPIMKRNQSYQDRGGKFIKVLPELPHIC